MNSSDPKKPKVLHLVGAFLNRTEHFIYDYLTAFEGIEAQVLTQYRVNRKEFPYPRIKLIRNDRITKRSFWWIEGAIYRFLRRKSLMWDRIGAFIREYKPDLIHAHFGQTGYDALPLKRGFSIPLITTFYGYDMSGLPRLAEWQKKYRELFSEGDLFLVEGPFMRNKLISLGAPEKKTDIQPIGIRLDRYPRWQPSAGAPTVLFVARFIEKKGLIYALAAVRLLKQTVPDLRFKVIGDGPERQNVVRFIKENRMKDYVSLGGMKSHEAIVEELKQAHVLVQPSVTARDGDSEGGAPTVLLEAQAVGIPVVSTLHADIPNICKEGAGVYLCEERDAAGLAQKMKTALEEKRGADGSFVARYHDVRKEARRLEEKYSRLLKQTALIR